MDVDDYVGRDGMFALFDECMRLAAEGDVETLLSALTSRAGRTNEKAEVPRIASAALVCAGEDGLAALRHFLEGGVVGGRRASATLQALWLAASGRPLVESAHNFAYREVVVDQAVRERARITLDDFIAGAATNAEQSRILVQLQHQELLLNTGPTLPSFNAHVLEVTREASIVLTMSLIEEWEALVDRDGPESDYQDFLEKHPVFLDPLAAAVLNRKKLGLELVTDFVVRRHDLRHVVVEIEKPQDRLFTQNSDFTAPFTHAYGQVLDFQGWVAENTAYAQKHLPGIESPHGLLIMGRRRDMMTGQEAKLRHWLVNSKNIEVLTFDDLSVRARALHASLRGAGPEKHQRAPA